jgi:hypothetical protein
MPHGEMLCSSASHACTQNAKPKCEGSSAKQAAVTHIWGFKTSTARNAAQMIPGFLLPWIPPTRLADTTLIFVEIYNIITIISHTGCKCSLPALWR